VATDKLTGEGLIGATVSIGTNGTLTAFDGSYSISVELGSYDLVVSYVGYKTKITPIDVRGDQTVNIVLLENSILDEIVVTADIAIERETPVAFSNIPTIKIEEELAAQDIPMLLNSTPGAYATEAGGGDGDARISIRGFDQRNVAVLLDGIPVNDMENGNVFWSNWFGLDLVTQTMQVQRGLGASKISIPSVGGTINILTKGIDAKKGLRIKQELGNNNYTRTTLGLTSGRMKNDWAFSLAGSYKKGDGWVDGNFTEGYFWYGRIDKQINNHYISLAAFGAPQKHGQRPFSAEAGLVDTAYALSIGVPQSAIEELSVKNKGRRYNDAWGLNDGELYNTRQNFYHKPQISLRHSWDRNKFFWSNVAYLSIGNGGGTATDGLSIPLNENDQRDINQTIKLNQEINFANPDGNSSTILRANRNNHFWYGILSTLRYTLNENITISGGFDGRSYDGDHFREVYDLLGGAGWKNGNNAPDSPTYQVGDKYEYDYTGLVRSIGGFGLFEYKKDKWASFLNVSAANSGYGFRNNFTDFEIPFVNVPTYTVKLGATYNFNKQNGVFVNTGILSKAQQYRNVIISNFWDTESEGTIANTYDNEEIKAVELGYNYKSRIFSANLNL